MRLVLLAGAHYTEEKRLTQTLLRNRAGLAARGVAMPAPDGYRMLVRDTLNAMHGAPLSDDAREVLLDAIVEDVDPKQVILSDPNFFRTAGTAIQKGVLYPAAPRRMVGMTQLFPNDALEIFIAIRNPAAMLPVLHQVAQQKDVDNFWGGRQPQQIRWSETIGAIHTAVPDVPITVFCNEDLPLTWSQIIREMAGFAQDEKIVGGFDLLQTIMSKEGMQRFRAYLDNHPGMSESQKRRVIMAFLEKFAIDEEIEEELDMLGWTDALVEELSALYDDDVNVIQQMPGVRVIMP